MTHSSPEIERLLRLADNIVAHGANITYPSRQASQEVRNVVCELAVALRSPAQPAGEPTPTKEEFAKWARAWHETCETMLTLLGLPGNGSPQEMLAQVQAYAGRAQPQEVPSREDIARIIEPHAFGTVEMHGRQNASEHAVRTLDYALSRAEAILALSRPQRSPK